MDIKNTLRVHSIETFGTLDGPGIRFVIFLQGCPLKCLYCHNRDTWDTNLGNITEVADLISEIKRYVPYMKSSGGGVTVSGGEPLLQAKIITELFKELHKLDIHTCIDTAGSLPINDDITSLLKVTDLVLLDIKHIDDEKSKILTGLSNKNNLDFAKYLSNNNIPVWIRQVILPSYTDDENDLLKLKDFIESLSNVEKIELLPYHDLGKFKWKELGFEYSLNDVKSATQEDINRAKTILNIS
ncbi:MAG: pyruvate formate lyase-activating protein [Clostridia bacterium]|jgi:pyruvate formate lyase activating enzyme|nr:pyruvate formate lyase-activating protein [Clostridia bacterium]